MNKYLDAAGIALSAIWAAKLRSLMTVLGNIVAVTSIIAVVSLIQGLNASVKSAILNQAGSDSFNIQQYPITRSDEEFEKVRNNPRMTLGDVRAIRRNSELAGSVMADAGSNGRVTYRDRSIDQTRIQGVTDDYVNFSSFDAERGRLMSPAEVQTSRPVAVIGWGTADRLGWAECTRPLYMIDGFATQAAPGEKIEYTVPDMAGRPWTKAWEEYFEKTMERPKEVLDLGFK
jgi:putative ABC transport system permease protein